MNVVNAIVLKTLFMTILSYFMTIISKQVLNKIVHDKGETMGGNYFASAND